MLIINERSHVRDVAKRWERQYASYMDSGSRGELKKVLKRDAKDVLFKLKSLDVETATAEDVKNIIGNDSWVCDTKCDECGKAFGEVVQLGEEPDYESHTICICSSCLIKAVKLLGMKLVRE